MKLMTYNLLNGAAEQFDTVINIVNSESPDFLTLNEANGFDADNNRLLDEFAIRTHFPHYHLTKCGDWDEYHVAVFSKSQIKEVEELTGFARAAIAVVIINGSTELHIIATHLTPYTEDLRLQEVNRIITYQKNLRNVIIMGDLNSLSSTDRYDHLKVRDFNVMQLKKFTTDNKLRFDVMTKFANAGFADPAILRNKRSVYTAPTSLNELDAHSNMRLDYILISKSLVDKLTVYKVVKNELTEIASDHYPVVIELNLAQ